MCFYILVTWGRRSVFVVCRPAAVQRGIDRVEKAATEWGGQFWPQPASAGFPCCPARRHPGSPTFSRNSAGRRPPATDDKNRFVWRFRLPTVFFTASHRSQPFRRSRPCERDKLAPCRTRFGTKSARNLAQAFGYHISRSFHEACLTAPRAFLVVGSRCCLRAAAVAAVGYRLRNPGSRCQAAQWQIATRRNPQSRARRESQGCGPPGGNVAGSQGRSRKKRHFRSFHGHNQENG